MRVLVGPVLKNQGLRDDYCYTDRGEVLFSWDCPCTEDNCTRHSFSGITSGKSSAFAEVAERPDLTEAQLLKLFVDHLESTGLSTLFSTEEMREMATEELALCRTLQFLQPGEIVARIPEGVYVPEQFRDSAKILSFRTKVA